MTKAERIEKQKIRFQEMTVIEGELREKGFQYIGGVDEVGRGPLAGPVVTACVVLPEDFDVIGIDDSKKLTEKKREYFFDIIMESAVAVGIGMETNQTIDEINILNATKSAMQKAVEDADRQIQEKLGKDKKVDFIIVDAVRIPNMDREQLPIVKGDEKSLSVACASVIAKVTRDRMMVEYDNDYPGYLFAKNKGYGTKDHYRGLDEHGVTPIHRQSFLKSWYQKRG